MTDTPQWAVLAAATPDALATHLTVDDELDEPTRTIVTGTGDYNAIVELEPGEEDLALDLAKELAKQTGRDAYALLLAIQTSLDDREAFRFPPRGKPKRLDEDPGDIAKQLGCPIPLPEPIEPEQARSVMVAVGITEAELRRQISTDGFDVVATQPGVVLYDPDGEGWHGPRAEALTRAYPNATVYTIRYAKEQGIVVMRYAAGKLTGAYDDPPRENVDDEYSSPIPTLHDIEGETEPLKIFAKLDVDPALLQYPGDVSRS